MNRPRSVGLGMSAINQSQAMSSGEMKMAIAQIKANTEMNRIVLKSARGCVDDPNRPPDKPPMASDDVGDETPASGSHH